MQEVIDESGGCGKAFQVVAVSAKFDGVALIDRHRMITDQLKTEMEDIHAIKIKAMTPAQWEKKKATAS
eukprot:EC715679.1.p3 GENE.EC715679.1~~EC715679.1.p3  ORF type:complete len:69 (+),score=23.46 EC715679.1:154-360(+)